MEWLKIGLIIIAIIVVLFIVLLMFSGCVLAGRYDEAEERYLLQHQPSVSLDKLSDLEKSTLNELLRAYDEDGVNMVSGNNMEQYEEGEN